MENTNDYELQCANTAFIHRCECAEPILPEIKKNTINNKDNMRIIKEFSKRLVESMFFEWSFDIEIELIDDDCFFFQIGKNNNQIELHTKLLSNGQLEVSIYKRSESFSVLGVYDLSENEFDRNSDFFELMFSEHLID